MHPPVCPGRGHATMHILPHPPLLQPVHTDQASPVAASECLINTTSYPNTHRCLAARRPNLQVTDW